MNNSVLKSDLKTIIGQKANVAISKSTLSGAGIQIYNTKTGEDIGCYTYYSRTSQRDSDFETLNNLING